MRLFKSSLLKKFAINMGIFMILSIAITFLSTKLPERYYHYKKWIYRERKWENGGRFYQDVFKVRLWKGRVPELADFVNSTFPKKSIKEFQSEYISKYLIESCKAELTHWSIIFSSVLFLLWEDTSTFIYMLLVSIILNIPFIIIQRYNRPRIIEIMKNKGVEF